MVPLQTERLILRQWRESDLIPYAAMNADPEVRRFFPSVLSSAESDAQVARFTANIDRNGWGFWALEREADGVFIGFVGLAEVTADIPMKGEVEIGWRLGLNHWGRGYATEAAQRALQFAFEHLNLPRVVSFAAKENHASIAVMRWIGLHQAPEFDFDWPDLPADHPHTSHVVYVSDATNWRPASSPVNTRQ